MHDYVKLFNIPEYVACSEREQMMKILEEVAEVENELDRNNRDRKLLVGEVADLLQAVWTLSQILGITSEEMTESLEVKFKVRGLIL